MKTCKTCGKPINSGGASGGATVRCLICRTTDAMQTFTYAGADVDYGDGVPAEPRAFAYGIRKPARNARIVAMVLGGEHAGDVALKFGLSRGRVLQIVQEARRG